MPTDIAAVLTANIDQFKARLGEANAELKATTDSGASNFQKLSAIGKTAFLGIGAAIIGVGAAAIDFGDKLEASQNSLKAALNAAGISWDSVKGSVDATGAAATHFGFTQAQVDGALALGIISTQNYASAHRNLQIAIQLAAARHIDLSQAMQIVDKAAIGQTRALKQMGIDLAIPATNAEKLKKAQDAVAASTEALNLFLFAHGGAVAEGSKAYPAYLTLLGKAKSAHEALTEQQNAGTQILDALSKRLSGQAAGAADTFAGRIAAIKAQGENLVANLGMRLIPILEKVVTAIMDVVQWFEKHKSAAEAIGIAIGVLVAGPIAAYIVAMAAAAIETVIAAAPILAIVAAVTLVGVAIYELVTHWQTVWTAIKSIAMDVWNNFLGPVFNFIKTLGTDYVEANITIMQGIWNTAWTAVQTVVSAVWGVIGPIFGFIKTLGTDYIAANIIILQGIWNAAWSGIQGAMSVAQGIISFIASAINFVIGGIEGAINALGSAWSTVWNGIVSAVNIAAGPIMTVIHGIEDAINFITGGGGGPPTGIPGGAPALPPGMSGGSPVGTPISGAHALFNIPSANGTSISPPIAVGSGGAMANVQLVLDGAIVGQVLVPILQSAFLQAQRSQVSLGFQ